MEWLAWLGRRAAGSYEEADCFFVWNTVPSARGKEDGGGRGRKKDPKKMHKSIYLLAFLGTVLSTILAILPPLHKPWRQPHMTHVLKLSQCQGSDLISSK